MVLLWSVAHNRPECVVLVSLLHQTGLNAASPVATEEAKEERTEQPVR
jgi:hypothetical protein